MATPTWSRATSVRRVIVPEPGQRISISSISRASPRPSSACKLDEPKRLLRWLDQAYEAMHDLTGTTPYGGAVIQPLQFYFDSEARYRLAAC